MKTNNYPTIFFLILFFTFFSCGGEEKVAQKNEDKKIKKRELIIFMDFYTGNFQYRNKEVFSDHIPALIGSLCENEKDVAEEIDLYLFPLNHNSGNSDLLGTWHCDAEESKLDNTCDNRPKKCKKALAKGIKKYYKNNSDNTNEGTIKIMSSLYVLGEKLSNINFEEKEVCIIYLSDLFELNGIADPAKGKFSFLNITRNKAQHLINDISVSEAFRQMKVKNSPIQKIVSDYKEYFKNGTKKNLPIYFFDLGHLTANSTENYNKNQIKMFWREFFEAADFEPHFYSTTDNLTNNIFND